jgi:hypothetical protein
VVAVVATACSIRAGRLPSVLLVAQLIVLFAAPVYFWFYADYVMPALCLAFGAAVHSLTGRVELPAPARRSGTVAGALLVAMSAALFVRVDTTHPPDSVLAAPGAAMKRATLGVRCVQSDSPMPLILLDVLSRDLRNGCPQWVDVSGRTYGVDRSPTNLPRTRNQIWQRDLIRYLLAGEQYALVDEKREGLNRQTLKLLRRGPVIARSPDFVLHRRVSGQAG